MRLFTLEPEREQCPLPPLATLVPLHPGGGLFPHRQGTGAPWSSAPVHVPGGVRHNFGNTGKGQLMALCIVPPEGDVNPLNGC